MLLFYMVKHCSRPDIVNAVTESTKVETNDSYYKVYFLKFV